VRQCEVYQGNKECHTLPVGDGQTLHFLAVIFAGYAIDFMGPLDILKGKEWVLVAVDRAV